MDSEYQLRQEVWQQKLLAPIPFLSELRATVLQHNAKRCPKWRFRVAQDLAVQIQPRPTRYISDTERAHGVRQQQMLFLGVAVCEDNLSVSAFKKHILGVA